MFPILHSESGEAPQNCPLPNTRFLGVDQLESIYPKRLLSRFIHFCGPTDVFITSRPRAVRSWHCKASLKWLFYLRHFKTDKFTLHLQQTNVADHGRSVTIGRILCCAYQYSIIVHAATALICSQFLENMHKSHIYCIIVSTQTVLCGLLLQTSLRSAVCLSVCVGHDREPCTNRKKYQSRCRLGEDLRGPMSHVLDEDTHWRHLTYTMEWSVRRQRCELSLQLLYNLLNNNLTHLRSAGRSAACWVLSLREQFQSRTSQNRLL